MANNIQRFLGFAFASADLLVELTPDGRVAFAVGAAKAVTGFADAQIAGMPWRELIVVADHAMVEAMLGGLEGGVRRGPLTIEFAAPDDAARRVAALSACLLPGAVNISCAMSASGASARPQTDTFGFQSRSSFEGLSEDLLEAAKVVGQELDFALVETPGFRQALEGAGEAAEGIARQFSGALRAESFGGAAATQLGPDRYAVIRSKASGPDLMSQRLSAILAAATGDSAMKIQARVLGVDSSGESLERSMRALRYAMDQFVSEGAAGQGAGTLTEAFNQSLQNTLAKAGAIGQAIKNQTFNLVYQPIVSLKTGKIEHYETLVRFQEDTSPFEMIRLAEELALIEHLDLAVAAKAFGKLKADRTKSLQLAVNVSGRSIEDPAFITQFRQITATEPGLINRMIVEVTESAAIKDLKLANRNIQILRAEGHKVCLDDFGAGASSMAYLQNLKVDVVKIDGQYIREMTGDGREAAFVRHIVGLCRELGVTTIAEMIETQAVEDAVKRAGVDAGQGYLYGKAAAEPSSLAGRSAPMSSMAARRKGAVESWG